MFLSTFSYREIQFLAPVQSRFVPGDSTVNQLTYIYNTLCKALDNGLEVRAIVFDISKAFDIVWHMGLLAKLQSAGITGPLFLAGGNVLFSQEQFPSGVKLKREFLKGLS